MASQLPSGGKNRTGAYGGRGGWMFAILGALLVSTGAEGFQTLWTAERLHAKHVRPQSARRRGGTGGFVEALLCVCTHIIIN